MKVLSWKTISVKFPLVGPGNPYEWREMKLPCEIQYKLHKHNNEVKMWFDFTKFNFYQQCECGYRDEWAWEMTWPDSSDAQTTSSIINTIKPQHRVLWTVKQ